jgi:large subunit ribosomal protein L21
MEQAVIKTGGKQFVVSPGTLISVEKLSDDSKEGDSVVFDEVLLLDDGTTATIGAPFIAGAKVMGTVTGTGKGKKIDVVKYKAKSRYLKRRGHRQVFAKVRIESIG